ncbi:histidinol dehydrogenase [Caldicellulosiruptoraceae bacterium PP1]
MKIVYYNNFSLENFIKDKEFINQKYEQDVKTIIDYVKKEKDKALVELTNKFDCNNFTYDDLIVPKKEIDEAYNSVEKDFLFSLENAYKNIYEFHSKQKEESWFYYRSNSMLGQIIRPLENVGIYVPGGNAAYPSTVLMNAVPATVACVSNIYMVSPPGKDKKINKYILAAAKFCNIENIYKIGGAQAIAALSFGTETIPKVDKIVGPGNIWVATAKKLLYGVVDIDMIAGPSEILIIADETANPNYIAHDLLSQAEHDINASSILITTSEKLAHKVYDNVFELLSKNSNSIAKKSIDENAIIIIVNNLKTATDISNRISPEHLEIVTNENHNILRFIKNAGSIFLGEYSPEPIGDYIAGPNHVLPTGGTARFFSPLGVYNFIKRMSIIEYSKEQFEKDALYAINIAKNEGLNFHAQSLKVRL